jgi:hypothetical protein
MTEEQLKIINEYFEYLNLIGNTIDNPKFSLKIFFKYTNEMNIDYIRLRISDAQDFPDI